VGEMPPDAGPRILIVEDDERIASFMCKALRAKGFSVEWVAAGSLALERLATGGFDLQLLDLGLPDVDGIALLRQLNETGDPTPTIVVTARSDPRDEQLARELGARAYLTKPFALADLIGAVRDGCRDATDASSPPA
jgi:two-component system, OmpR family, copper resistance phosphate regulon response regulator CusR